MIAYAFYWLEEIDKVHFVGLLPERRNNPERITQQSISNYGRIIVGNEAHIDDLFFLEMELDEMRKSGFDYTDIVKRHGDFFLNS